MDGPATPEATFSSPGLQGAGGEGRGVGRGCWQGPGGLRGGESVFVLGESVSAINPCPMAVWLLGGYDLFQGPVCYFRLGIGGKKKTAQTAHMPEKALFQEP